MSYNTQNKKIKFITGKTLIVGIDVVSETHQARAFDWLIISVVRSHPEMPFSQMFKKMFDL